jgi:hypothetical protein
MENKTGKYFKYAIGEIILVVIGILIALQINNWNQSQNNKRIESQYLKNIVRDLQEQLSSLDVQMENEQIFYEAASYLIEDYNIDNTFALDSIFYNRATILTSRKTFVITDPTYTDLISSGNIKVIKNQEYKDAMLSYYQELERVEKVIQSNNTFLIDQHYVKAYNKNGYHYDGDLSIANDRLVSQFPGHIVVPKYKTELQETSKNILLKEENKLEFLNAIYFRQSIALGHYELLLNIKKDTDSLIKKINN